MKKTFLKTAAILSTAGLIALSTTSMVCAFEDENVQHGQIYGISLNGDFGFNKVKVTGFAHTPVGFEGSTTGASPFFQIDGGIAKTHLPLFTFGDDVKYPGIFYNSGDTQFFDIVANAAEGDDTSAATITLYAAAAGAAIAAGIVAADVGTSGSTCTPRGDGKIYTFAFSGASFDGQVIYESEPDTTDWCPEPKKVICYTDC